MGWPPLGKSLLASFAPLRLQWGPNFLLLTLLVAAFALRIYGIDWDDGYGFHPDERSFYLRADDMFRALTEAPGHEVWLNQWPGMEAGLPSLATALSAERSPLNPHWFPLGSILIYALVLIRSVAELFTDWGAMDMRLAGRTLTALADVVSVWLMYVIGRRMYGPWTGILAAAFTTFAVIHIQNAHFYRPEPFTVLASLASLWAMLRFIDTRRASVAALLGALVGLAMAPKVSVAPILAPLALTFLWVWKDHAGGRWSNLNVLAAVRFAPMVIVAALSALAAYFITTPYAFLDYPQMVSDIQEQSRMVRDAFVMPFTRQYVDTPIFWYQIRQTAVWGLGLPLGIVAWLATPFTAWMAWRGGIAQRADLLLLAWAVPGFVFLELFEVKFLRYVFPLMPFYVLMAARMLIAAVHWSREARRRAASRSVVEPHDAPFSEEWHATPPTVGDDVVFDEPIFGEDAPFSEEWHATPPVAGVASRSTPPLVPMQLNPPLRRSFNERWQQWIHHCPYPASIAVLAIILLATMLYAIAFVGIYSRPHTAVAASEWINTNVPSGTPIVNGGSFWDERVPNLSRYDVWIFPAYHPDTDRSKIPELVSRLTESDYIVFYSNRAYGAVSRLPDEYPQSSAFFHRLFSGDLGYRLEKAFTSYPALAGVQLRDDPLGRAGLPKPVRSESADQSPGVSLNLGYADENVIGYDHPQVLIFSNVERLTADTLQERIDRGIPDPRESASLMLSASAREAQRTGGTWANVFKRDGLANRLPWLAWLLVIEMICLVAFPVTWWLLRPLPDRGVLLARVLGLLLVAWVAWMLVNAGVMRFSAGTVWLALGVVAVPSAVVLWRQWRLMLDWVRAKWRLIITAEALFILAYLAFTFIRAANPDLWHPWRGGEKPMELAYFTAVARSVAFPPYDPWYSGGYLNYYYWGYYILSIPTRITSIPPTVAFNLAVPLLFSLTATGVGGLVYNMVAAARPSSTRPHAEAASCPSASAAASYRRGLASNWLVAPVRRIARWPITAAGVAGLIAAAMTVVAGNLDGTVQLYEMAEAKIQGAPAPLSGFDFWRSSRAIPEIAEFQPSRWTPWLEASNDVETAFHITEFPFFTFLFADLHAHMMSMPFALTALTLGFALLCGLTTRQSLQSVWPWATVALFGLATGSLWAINSWEYPAYALLMVGLIGAGAGMLPGGLKSRGAIAAVLAALALAVSYVAFLPFHSATETFGTGIEPTRWRTPLPNYALIHALPLLGATALLAATLPSAWQPLARRVQYGTRMPALHRWLVVAVAVGILLACYLLAAGFLTAGLLTILLALAGGAWATLLVADGDNNPTRRPDLMALSLLGIALAIGIGVDFIRVEHDIGRMNTLFKYYLVAWLLFSAAGAYGFWRGGTTLSRRGSQLARYLRWPAATVVGLVAAGVLVYPALATPVRIADRFNPTPPTLDGAAWMPQAQYHLPEWCAGKPGEPIDLRWDYDAIQWLQEHAVGTPVILEAHGIQYCWNSRFSQYTGLPTVIGWPWHQTQQRNDERAIRRRAQDVATIYNTSHTDTALKLLDDYNIIYIVVGDLERLYYLPHGIAKFDAMVATGSLTLDYRNDRTRVYRVAGR